MRTLSMRLVTVIAVSSLSLLSACGGGGGDSDTGGGNTQTSSKTFTVGLVSVDVNRISNGDTVAVDTSGINSGTLTLNQ